VNAVANSMLVVVDVQKGFVTQHSEHALPAIRRALVGWQAVGAATVLTQFVNAPDSPYVRIIGWSKLMPDDPAIEFHPAVADLAAHATAVVRKSRYSSLTAEVLRLLAQRGLDHIYVAGLDTESCVLATALAAFEQGYTPWILTDACASHAGTAEHQAGLLVARRYIGERQLVTTGSRLDVMTS
jgi:nicotinamidase-related amidase